MWWDWWWRMGSFSAIINRFMDTNTNPPLLEWTAPAKVVHERSEKWYLVAGLLCAIMIIYGILIGAWSLSICVAMIAGLSFLIRNEGAHVHRIRILDIGIEFDGKPSIWSDWKHFWILRGEGYHELHIESRKPLTPDLVIQTGEIDPYAIRDQLSQYLVQIDHQKEKILDAIIRFCKL